MANIERCFIANGISPDYYDADAEYDETLTVGENIRNAIRERGLRTTREWRDEILRWKMGG